MEHEHYLDAATKEGRLKKPVKRPDQNPPHPNPIRAFREELRLEREEFGELMNVPVQTLRVWERTENAYVPRYGPLTRLIELARKNEYPLYWKDIMSYAESTRVETCQG